MFTAVAKKIFLLSFFTLFLQPPVSVVLFFGDSITAGHGLSVSEAFPALAETLLKKKKNIKAINSGLSGETSAGGLNRIEWVLRQPIDIFVLELGANDALRGLPIDQTKTNLASIIDLVRKKNPAVKIILAGMLAPPNMGKEYTYDFKQMYISLAKEKRVTLIPFLLEGVAGNPKLNLSDGIHPNVEGHKIVANTVINALDPLL